MANKPKALTAVTIKNLKTPGYHRDRGDGAARGLYLQVMHAKSGILSKSWVYRFVSPVSGKPRWMGLGSADVITLADARELATAARRTVILGRDPIDDRQTEREARKIEAAKKITFEEGAARYMTAHRPSWKNAKHAAQWSSTLATYAYPVMGKLPVASVDTAIVLKAVEPIWTVKPETASRVRQRIEAVLDWATARGYRHGDNPARLKGHLENLLPRASKVKRVRNHPALAYADMPEFMNELRDKSFVSGRALEFLILTAARTNEVIGATWEEIDLLAKTWTIPGERMKAGKPHIVPLSERALKILEGVPRERGNPHVFVGARKGRGLSNTAMLELMKGMRPGYVPHGFRSTFRDWAGDRTSFDRQTIEHALAHGISDATEAAYRRATAVEKRRRLMQAWSDYCAALPKAKADNVIAIQAGA